MDFEPVQLLEVFWSTGSEEFPIGKLAIDNGHSVFKYDPDFLTRDLSISPKYLPNQIDPRECKYPHFDHLFGVFNDSLPDGWGKLLLDRELLSRQMDPEMLTPLDRLAYVGEFGMGALVYRPNYDQGLEETNRLDLTSLAAESRIILAGESSEMIEKLRRMGGSSQGARPKVIADYNRQQDQLLVGGTSSPEGYEPWLIKFGTSTDPDEIGRIEYAYSMMAKAAQIEMEETRLFPGTDGDVFFGTKRFDRAGKRRIHMHTAAGLLHSTHRLPSLDYGNLIHETLELNKDMSEATKVFRLAVFNLYTFNRDDHSKNFSFLLDTDGIWRFAPAYDLTYSNGPGGQHSTIYAGEGANPNSGHLMELANHFGMKKAKTIIDDVKGVVSEWSGFAAQAELGEEWTGVIQARIQELLNQ